MDVAGEPTATAPPTGTPQPDSESAHLGSLLAIAVMRLARRLRAERSDDTLGLSQLSALATLERHGPLSPTALAELERIQPPSMTRLIAALEGRGLVERRAHPSDRRQAVIAITVDGRDIVIEDRRRRNAWLSRTLEGLNEDEQQRLMATLPILEQLSES
jgi:DNA-binding MarR family transcriptional regulator